MATYSNQHWLLSHIRNSFISTDDTGMCETVMLSDDLPKHYLRKFQGSPSSRKSTGNSNSSNVPKSLDPSLQEVDFICYPGLDQSDDEDMDLSSQSFDIQMFPEVGAHRFRSNTAQKLEKMDIARRKAARTKSVNFDDEIVPPERSDFFVKKPIPSLASRQIEKIIEIPKTIAEKLQTESSSSDLEGVKSKLSQQLANSPKQAQNKFMEYARFDGTSQTEYQTKRINVFLSMLPERERNYPIKICVLASAKIIEVIGLVCYKATIQYPDIPLKSIRHYALYMTEDNDDDMADFPPLDNREPCSKFGFSHLTLAERRPLASVTRMDYHNVLVTKSMTSEEDKARLAAAAVRSLQSIELNGSGSVEVHGDAGDTVTAGSTEDHASDYEARMLSHNDMLQAPLYRTYRLHIIDKPFFKTEVTLSISGERIEIDQHKNAKFWTKQKAVTHPIDAVAFCEVVERRHLKATLRIWLKSSSSGTPAGASAIPIISGGGDGKSAAIAIGAAGAGGSGTLAYSPSSPSQFHSSTHFTLSGSLLSGGQQHQAHIRFKHYDFEADTQTAEQILNKLNCILKVRSSEVRREFLHLRERKLEKSHSKKHLKL